MANWAKCCAGITLFLIPCSDPIMRLYSSRPGYSDEPTPVSPLLLQTDASLNRSSTFAFTATSDTGSPYWHFFVAPLNWQSGCLDAVLARVATDAVADILVIGQEQKCVYHPYDGGGDIIVRNEEARTALEQIFSGWLSPTADGL
jgi:hypothetical protein